MISFQPKIALPEDNPILRINVVLNSFKLFHYWLSALSEDPESTNAFYFGKFRQFRISHRSSASHTFIYDITQWLRTFHCWTVVTYPNLSVINSFPRWLEDPKILIVVQCTIQSCVQRLMSRFGNSQLVKMLVYLSAIRTTSCSSFTHESVSKVILLNFPPAA